jgi:hypothetical protein
MPFLYTFVYKYSELTQHSSENLLMMEAEVVSEMSDTNSTLMWLTTQENLNFSE